MPFVEAEFQIEVWIDMPLAEAQKTFAPWRVATMEHSGGTRLKCSRDRLQMFAAMLLSFNRRVVIYSPNELRQTFAQIAEQAAHAARS